MINKMSRSVSNKFHLVVSTKDKQEPLDLVAFLSKHSQKYIVSVEYGQNGHPHLDSYFVLEKEQRQDKIRDKLIKNLYTHVDNKEKINIKVVVNTIDPDERYGFGYSFKENPREYWSNQSKKYLDECVDYYFKAKDKVKKSLDKFKEKPVTIDLISEMFLQYVIDGNSRRDPECISNMIKYPIVDAYSFRHFYVMSDVQIPASLYQRLNIEKLLDWCNLEYSRHMRLVQQEKDCVENDL